jgi:uncharacterized membrane protein YkvA (DUF1232 family)
MPEKKNPSPKKKPAKKTATKKTVKKPASKKTAGKKTAPPRLPMKKPGRLEAGLRNRAGKITEGDIGRIVKKEKDIGEKLKKVPGMLRKLINQVKLLYAMMRDYKSGLYREVPWYSIAMAAAAILYFLNPLDFIPDWLFLTGFLDDAAVLALAFRALRDDLVRYCAFKGCDPDMYF